MVKLEKDTKKMGEDRIKMSYQYEQAMIELQKINEAMKFYTHSIGEIKRADKTEVEIIKDLKE